MRTSAGPGHDRKLLPPGGVIRTKAISRGSNMSGPRRSAGGKTMAKDPVCGMQVDEKKAAATSTYQGTTYYFCAPGCKVTFDKNPEKFTGKAGGHRGH